MHYILAVYTVQALTQTFNSADLHVHEPAGVRVNVNHVHGADVLVHTHTPTCMCILPTCACTMPTCTCTGADVHVHSQDVPPAGSSEARALLAAGIPVETGSSRDCVVALPPTACKGMPFRPDSLLPYLALLLTQTQVFGLRFVAI